MWCHTITRTPSYSFLFEIPYVDPSGQTTLLLMTHYTTSSHAHHIIYSCLKYHTLHHPAKPRYAKPRSVTPRNVQPRCYSCLWYHTITRTPYSLFLFEISYVDSPRQTTSYQTTYYTTTLLLMSRYATPSHTHFLVYFCLKYRTLTPRYAEPRYAQPRYYSCHVITHHHTYTTLFIPVWNTVRWPTAPHNVIPNHAMPIHVIKHAMLCHTITRTPSCLFLFEIPYVVPPHYTTLCPTPVLLVPRYATPSHVHRLVYSCLKYCTLTHNATPRYVKARYSSRLLCHTITRTLYCSLLFEIPYGYPPHQHTLFFMSWFPFFIHMLRYLPYTHLVYKYYIYLFNHFTITTSLPAQTLPTRSINYNGLLIIPNHCPNPNPNLSNNLFVYISHTPSFMYYPHNTIIYSNCALPYAYAVHVD